MGPANLIGAHGWMERTDTGGGREIYFAEEDRAIALNVCALRDAEHLRRILRPQSGDLGVQAALHAFDHAAIHFGSVGQRSGRERAQRKQGKRRDSHCLYAALLAISNRATCFW